MKFRNQWIKYRFQDEEGGDAGGQGGGGGNTNNNNSGQQNNNNTNNQQAGSIWDDGDAGTGSQQTSNSNNSGENTTPDPAAIFAKHVEGLNLAKGLDFASVEPGDHEGMQKLFQQGLANVYQAAMLDANRLVQASVEKAVEAAVSKSGENVNMTMAVKEMHSAMPWTSDPDVGPVAKAVLSRNLNKGLPLSQALENTRNYFKKVGGLVNGTQNGNNNNRSNFSAHNQQNGESTDFLSLFGSPAEE